MAFIFQLKERAEETSDPDAERHWFQRKVLRKATDQIKASLRYLAENEEIRLGHGYEVAIRGDDLVDVKKIVVFLPGRSLPEDCWEVKFHISATAGFIHVLAANDYLGVLGKLRVPDDVRLYFEYRESVLPRLREAGTVVEEADIMVGFLSDKDLLEPGSIKRLAFTDEEREHYAYLRGHPNEAKAMHNLMSLSIGWTKNDFVRSGLTICRSPIPIRTLSAPVMAIAAPSHAAFDLPLPGMTPFQLVLALDPKTVAILVPGDFGDGFANIEIDKATARGFNRHFVGHFGHFDSIAHLISDREGLVEDMTWAPYDLIEESERRIKFRRRV